MLAVLLKSDFTGTGICSLSSGTRSRAQKKSGSLSESHLRVLYIELFSYKSLARGDAGTPPYVAGKPVDQHHGAGEYFHITDRDSSWRLTILES